MRLFAVAQIQMSKHVFSRRQSPNDSHTTWAKGVREDRFPTLSAPASALVFPHTHTLLMSLNMLRSQLLSLQNDNRFGYTAVSFLATATLQDQND